MDGSYLVIDTTGSSSVICLDSTTDSSGILCVDSSIVRQEGSEKAKDKKTEQTKAKADDSTPIAKLGRGKVKKENKEGTEKTVGGLQDNTIIGGNETANENDGQSVRRSKRLLSSSTPLAGVRKKLRISASTPLASTPLSGSAKTPVQPEVTPISVRYERIKCELSATKKQQAKLLSQQQEMQNALLNFQKKLEEKNTEEAVKITLGMKSNQDSFLRPIVIDGSNVAMSHGLHKVFSCRGIALCVQYFQNRGHKDITVIIPLSRKTTEAARECRIIDQHILDDLESKGLLSYTPSRQVNGRRITPYDDRFIVRLASQNDGVIISNDNYRDLMAESLKWRRVIENRLIMYVFAGDTFMVPDDPHGRYGPSLNDVLRKDSLWSRTVSPKAHRPPPAPEFTFCRGPIAQLRRSPRIARMMSMRNRYYY